MKTLSSVLILVSICAFAFFASGCGDGRNRWPLSGEVTLNGVPVPWGSVRVIPDSSQGNKGVESVAEISNGRYDMGKAGTGGGAVLIEISPFGEPYEVQDADGGEKIKTGKPLCPPQHEKIVLTKDRTTYDFHLTVPGADKRK